MTQDIVVGISLLVTIVLAQVTYRRWKLTRFKTVLQAAQDAIQTADWPAAETALRKGDRIVPGQSAVLTMLAGVLARQNKLDEAEATFRFASDLEPKNAMGHLNLALFYALSAKQADAAAHAFAKALELNPKLESELDRPELKHLRDHPDVQSILGNLGSAAE